MTGALIVLEGIDGAGKSTLRDPVASRLTDLGVTAHHTKEPATAPQFAHNSMCTLASLLWSGADAPSDHLQGSHYWLYLQALWYAQASRFVVEPKLTRGESLVADGWYFKFYAKLRLQGFETGFLDSVFAPALKPDVVVLLDPEVPAVWERRGFSCSEMGLHANEHDLGRESFVRYQSGVRESLLELGAEHGWIVASVHQTEDVARTADRVARLVRARLSEATTAMYDDLHAYARPSPRTTGSGR